MKVYLVGHNGPEHNSVISIHKTKEGALKSWNEIRKELLNDAKKSLKRADKAIKEMYERMVKNLSCTDPKKIDNYPQETPYIQEKEIQD